MENECAQVHEDGGYALAAMLRARVDLVVEEVVVRVILLADLRVTVGPSEGLQQNSKKHSVKSKTPACSALE